MRDLTEAQVAAGHSVGIVCDSTTGGAFEERLFEQMQDMLALEAAYRSSESGKAETVGGAR